MPESLDQSELKMSCLWYICPKVLIPGLKTFQSSFSEFFGILWGIWQRLRLSETDSVLKKLCNIGGCENPENPTACKKL